MKRFTVIVAAALVSTACSSSGFCRAATTLSTETAELASVFFDDDDLDCAAR